MIGSISASMSMPNNRFDRRYRNHIRTPYQKVVAVSVPEMSIVIGASPKDASLIALTAKKNVRMLNGMVVRRAYAPCIFFPRVQPEISPCGISFQFSTSQIPTTHFPSFPSYLLSILIWTSIHPSFICNWSLTYPWHPPLHRRRHFLQHRHAQTPIRPCTVLYLRTPRPQSHISTPPSQHRYCRDPASYSSFPPPLPGELGNPPARRARALPARPWHAHPDPILKPRSDFTSGPHSPIARCMICSSVHPSPTAQLHHST